MTEVVLTRTVRRRVPKAAKAAEVGTPMCIAALDGGGSLEALPQMHGPDDDRLGQLHQKRDRQPSAANR